MPQRRDYIDELKGLGILLVVLGHFIEQYRMGYSFVSASFFCIYAFHMALFCICSGLVARFNPRKLVHTAAVAVPCGADADAWRSVPPFCG